MNMKKFNVIFTLSAFILYNSVNVLAQLTVFPGASIPWGMPANLTTNYVAVSTALTIDATGEKTSYAGKVFYPDRSSATKAITKVGFRFAAVTKAGGSALTVSLQNVTGVTGAGTGGPMVGDETQD